MPSTSSPIQSGVPTSHVTSDTTSSQGQTFKKISNCSPLLAVVLAVAFIGVTVVGALGLTNVLPIGFGGSIAMTAAGGAGFLLLTGYGALQFKQAYDLSIDR